MSFPPALRDRSVIELNVVMLWFVCFLVCEQDHTEMIRISTKPGGKRPCGSRKNPLHFSYRGLLGLGGVCALLSALLVFQLLYFYICPGGGGAVISQRDFGDGGGQKHRRCRHVGGGQHFNGSHGA